MGLSSNTVTHFTKSLSNLKGILTENFKVRYCREIINAKSKTYDLLVPMVSFCDIPFSQIVNHIDSYGCYGIGLKKKWAEECGLNPVLYLDKHSSLTENMLLHLYKHLTASKSKVTELDSDEKCRFDIIRYTKNYQGDLNRIGKKAIKDYRFSDEREWRYVIDPKLDYPLFGNLKNITVAKIPEAKNMQNKKIETERLQFTPEDINYIIVKYESERDKVIETLEKVNAKYPHEQVKRLISRIISVEQLRTDF
ncbi:hypothetical protein EQG63_05780 [Flavobacterium amnicola]|uniref:Abortive phage resistance protein AbiGi, antitoxin n=1 Tax=Flavobacterium amnicola TaxID=2506422 RepID=A0A4Q1K2F7_9FLAO|nr:abortive infection system antitoxin AbiGi family protein [Flavobacterium amnicola]RXR18954.1 hypothetical protein EQG63_05780 [Flavobacterium amnicola]